MRDFFVKILKKIFKVTLLIIISIVAIITIWWFWPARTPQINSNGNNSISSLEYITIGGMEQCVLIRGENKNNPILLFLHGGPGMPMMYLAHTFQKPLEKDFVVVQWDRRGAGKTYYKNKPTIESMNVKQIIEDAFTLIDTLRNRYHQNKIFLAGHSFGTYLGSIMVNERPDFFKAYLSIGQVVDSDSSIIYQEQFIRKEAVKRGDKRILSVLNKKVKPNFEDWLFEFGGELKNSTSFFPLIWAGLRAPEYTLPEALNVSKGSSFSSAYMKYNILTKSVYYEITEYKIPVYFFIGVSDYTTPYELVFNYYQMVTAPKKEIIYFENSAHFPFYEEPSKFCNEIKRILITNNLNTP